MKTRLCGAVAAAVALLVLFGSFSTGFAAGAPLYWPTIQPWYSDMAKYTTYDFEYTVVHPLWSKNIVAGWVGWYYGLWGWYIAANFRPYDYATRLWYGQCLMEPYGNINDYTVRVPGTDRYWQVYYDYNSRANYVRWFAPYANKMAEKGLISWTESFVDGYLRRDEAFSWAIRAAGLTPVAQAVSDAEANFWLNKFPDGWRVDPRYRKDVALAVKLNIARGTSSGTLEPDSYLVRVHGAAIIQRTASIMISVPSSISVPGQTATITTSHVGFGTPLSYTLRIVNYAGSTYTKNVIYSVSGSGLPSSLTWNGKDSYGNYVNAGEYYVELDVQYLVEGRTSTYTAVPRPIRVVRDMRYFSANLYSSSVPDAGYLYFQPSYYSEAVPMIEATFDNTGSWQACGTSGWQRVSVPATAGGHTANFRAYLYQAGLGWGYFYDSKPIWVDSTGVTLSTDKSSFMVGQTVSIWTLPYPYSPSWGGYLTPVVCVRRLSDNALVRTLIGTSVTWDGRDASGKYCDSGTYRLEANVTFYQRVPSGAQPQWTRTAYKDVTFISWEIKNVQVTAISNAPPGNPALPTAALPVLVAPSSQVTVKCDTTGPAQQVKLRVGSAVYDGTPQYARGSITNTWTAVVTPGTSQHGAVIKLTVELYDSSGVLQKSYGPVDLMIVDNRSVSALSSASASGTYAVAGGKAYILVDVVGSPKSGPIVSGFGQSVTAGWDAARGKYVAVLSVPESTPDGTYAVSVSAVLSMAGWPDRTLSSVAAVPVRKEVLALTVSPQQFAPRLGAPLNVRASLRPVTTPVSSVLSVERPNGALVYTRLYSGLPAAMYWDGRDSVGSYCDTGGAYTVTVTATCVHDPGFGFPADTIQVSGSAVVQLPNVTTTQTSPGSVILIE